MLSLIAASLLSTAQLAGALQPLVVNLCNETPVRVAYSVVYPSGPRSERRRGWLTVEPGDCLSGAIGNSTGGTAFVHAMSGEYRWPAEGADYSSCLPGNEHDSLAQSPPCSGATRETGFAEVSLSSLPGRYRMDHTVACSDLQGSDSSWCATGRRDRSGFAEPVRTFAVCNQTANTYRVALAAEAPGVSGRRVEGWTEIPSAECVEMWRGLTSEGVVFAYSQGPIPMDREAGFAMHCIEPDADFARDVPRASEATCEPGQTRVGFRPVRYGDNVSRMTLDLGG